MSKTGRPKLDKATARTERLHVVLTPAERLEIIERAAAAGFPTVSDFVRATTLQRRLPASRPAREREGVFSADDRRALANLGNNLNQIARVIHSGREHAPMRELQETIAKLDELFDRYLPA